MAVKGITEKTLANGEKVIYVRFKYKNKNYGVRNFTKIFKNCKTVKDAQKKLREVKDRIDEGKDPFIVSKDDLDYYFTKTYNENIASELWSEATAKNYKSYYDKHIKKAIGWKKLSKITYANLDAIIISLANRKARSKNTLKALLNPIFKKALKLKTINENPADELEHYTVGKREDLDKRLREEDYLIATRKLYKAVALYKPKIGLENELNTYLYLLLMTAHRYGELLKLTIEDVYLDEKKIVSPAPITKTREDYHYPIPNECIEYFKTIKSGLLFPNLRAYSMPDYFSKLVALSEIKIFRNKSITAHDTRRLLLYIMIKNCKIDSLLADYCLEHKPKGVIGHYTSFGYKDKKEAYIKYWNTIRN